MAVFAADLEQLSTGIPPSRLCVTIKDGKPGVGESPPFGPKPDHLSEAQEVLLTFKCCPQCSAVASLLYASTYKVRYRPGVYNYRMAVHCGCLWHPGGRHYVRNDIYRDWR